MQTLLNKWVCSLILWYNIITLGARHRFIIFNHKLCKLIIQWKLIGTSAIQRVEWTSYEQYLYTSKNAKRCKSADNFLFCLHLIRSAPGRKVLSALALGSSRFSVPAVDLLEEAPVFDVISLLHHWPPGQMQWFRVPPLQCKCTPWEGLLLWILGLQRKDWSLRPRASPWRGTQSVISSAPLSAPFSTHRLSKSSDFFKLKLLGFLQSHTLGLDVVFLAACV